jgi:hypothetical protein
VRTSTSTSTPVTPYVWMNGSRSAPRTVNSSPLPSHAAIVAETTNPSDDVPCSIEPVPALPPPTNPPIVEVFVDGNIQMSRPAGRSTLSTAENRTPAPTVTVSSPSATSVSARRSSRMPPSNGVAWP